MIPFLIFIRVSVYERKGKNRFNAEEIKYFVDKLIICRRCEIFL